MNIESVRADERLIHGQLINEWLHVLKPTRLLVCDDALMQMPFMANMYRSLVPIWLEARILSLEQTVEYLRLHADTEGRIFLLFRTPESALQAWKRGIRFSLLTLADKQYFPQQARGSGAAEGGDPPSACRRCNGCGAGNAAF